MDFHLMTLHLTLYKSARMKWKWGILKEMHINASQTTFVLASQPLKLAYITQIQA